MTRVQDIKIHPPLIYSACIALMVIDIIMVGLRLWARKLSSARLGSEDYLCITALVFAIGFAVTFIVETARKTLGYPASVGDLPGHPNANIATYPMTLLQIPALGCIKLSFLFLYRRIFSKRVARNFNLVNWAMIVIVTCWMFAFIFLLAFLCHTDFSAFWSSTAAEKKACSTTGPDHLSYAITDFILDVLILILPVPEILKLHLPSRRRLLILGVFGLGAITTVMSAIRLAIYQGALAVQFDPDSDFEFVDTVAQYFSQLEIGLGIIAVCLPVQYGLLQSEKVHGLFRSVHSLVSMGSHRSSARASARNTPPDSASEQSRRQSKAPYARDLDKDLEDAVLEEPPPSFHPTNRNEFELNQAG